MIYKYATTGNEETELIHKFSKDRVEIKKEQDIQVERVKSDRSTFNRLYKEIKEGMEGMGGNKYWGNEEVRGGRERTMGKLEKQEKRGSKAKNARFAIRKTKA